MADASALGADTLGVWVQVPSSVPYKGIRTPQRERNRIFGFFFFCDLKLNEKKCGKTVAKNVKYGYNRSTKKFGRS